MNRAFPLLLAWLWATPALALDWFVSEPAEAEVLRAALGEVWPSAVLGVTVGEAPVEGDAVWAEGDTLVLRLDGRERRAEQLASVRTRVVLVRSWVESSELSLPPPPPPAPAPGRLQGGVSALHSPHLLPGSGPEHGLEVGVGAAGTGSLDTEPFEGAVEGYAPVLDLAAGFWRIRANATVWNLWETERTHRPMVLGGVSVVVVDRGRWRLSPWIGAAGGWKLVMPDLDAEQATTAFSEGTMPGFGGIAGVGVSLEITTTALTWDLSLPLAGLMTWESDDEPWGLTDWTTDRVWQAALLLPYPEAGVSWRLTDADTMRFGLLASVPSIRWRHDWPWAFVEVSAATSLGLGKLGDGDLLLGAALRGRVGVAL